MSLDSNLYTLVVRKSAEREGTVELVEERGGAESVVYSASRDDDTNKIYLIDPYTTMQHASLVTISPKLSLLELLNPRLLVELNAIGFISWENSFMFEGHPLCWRRDVVGLSTSERGYSLYVSRKPDPDWPVAVYKPNSKRYTRTLQFLDYNLARLEPKLEDRRGLEFIIVLSLIGFISDTLFTVTPLSPSPKPISTTVPIVPARSTSMKLKAGLANLSLNGSNGKGKDKEKIASPVSSPPLSPPILGAPTHPALAVIQKTLADKSLTTNELLITDSALLHEYLTRCLTLFSDESLLYVTLLAQSAPLVATSVQLAEEVKRKIYKRTGEELRQYIVDVDPTPSLLKDAASKDKYTAPTSIKIYLSRIPLEELIPAYKSKTTTKGPRPAINFDRPVSTPASVARSISKDGKVKGKETQTLKKK